MIPSRKITAPIILVGNGDTWQDKVIIIDESGKILKIDELSNHDINTVQKFEGMLLPGLINTHCHLELSHMKGKIPSGMGLVEFISHVVKFRDIDQSIIDARILEEDKAMFDAGIQAVGDICNKLDTQKTKSRSNIAYYSFVEMFDFMNAGMTDKVFEQYKAVYDGQSTDGRNKKSAVPHAPYSVSSALFEKLLTLEEKDQTVSIHNQETPPEDELFMDHSGDMVDFFGSIGLPITDFPTERMRSIFYSLPKMNPAQKTILVHNTQCIESDIAFAEAWSEKVYWATCPNANLYIENSLPDYRLFLDKKAKMTIGTDSLSSNWTLSIWDEMKTILKYKSYLSFDQVLIWACKNGAEALGYQDVFGTIAPGKCPGILHTDLRYENRNDDFQNAKLTRII